ncbi:MAG: glycosyltransferase [Candidatus Magasanikbacteria bacterium]|nr:glycosyltransferase [Candidatus Magasanikbacteria bacterium]
MLVAVVPAYNEEKRIGSVIRDLFEHVDKVLVVDDASTDNTFQEARKAGAIVLKHVLNRGQGAALQTGHEYANIIGADYVIHFDGDGQFSTKDISGAMQHMQEAEVDVLLGSRFLQKKSNIPWFKAKILLPLGRIINNLFSGLKLSDAHNGFRILNRKAFNKIKINQDRMAHATEIPAQIKKYNLKYVEFPIEVKYYEYGQNMAGGFKILRDLLLGKFLR